MKGLVGRPQGRLRNGVGEGVSSTEKAGNRTKTKSQLPTNSIREVWTSRGGGGGGWNITGWYQSGRRRDQKNKNASESWRKKESVVAV